MTGLTRRKWSLPVQIDERTNGTAITMRRALPGRASLDPEKMSF